MSIAHGLAARAYVGGVNLSNRLKEVSSAAERDMADASHLESTDREFVTGLRGGSVSLSGMFSARADVGDPLDIADSLNAAFGGESTIVCHLPQGDGEGKFAKCISGKVGGNPVSSPGGDIVSVNGEITSDTGIERGVILKAKGEESTGDNGNSIDEAASSVLGAAAYLQVFSVIGGTLTVKIQHSADDITFADLATFSAATAGETAERITVADGVTINRYVRALWTLTAGTADFFVGFHRELT